MDKHKRFYIDFPPSEYAALMKLADHLTDKLAMKVTRAYAVRTAVTAMARKEKVA